LGGVIARWDGRALTLVAQFADDVEQCVLVVADGVADKGFAHPIRGVQAVEGVSHLAATGMFAHQGLEAQGFLHDPVGFFAGRWRRAVISSRIWSRAPCKASALLPGEAFAQTGQGEERWCQEQSRDQHEEHMALERCPPSACNGVRHGVECANKTATR
jgi:hypothetical protein